MSDGEVPLQNVIDELATHRAAVTVEDDGQFRITINGRSKTMSLPDMVPDRLLHALARHCDFKTGVKCFYNHGKFQAPVAALPVEAPGLDLAAPPEN